MNPTRAQLERLVSLNNPHLDVTIISTETLKEFCNYYAVISWRTAHPMIAKPVVVNQ